MLYNDVCAKINTLFFDRLIFANFQSEADCLTVNTITHRDPKWFQAFIVESKSNVLFILCVNAMVTL